MNITEIISESNLGTSPKRPARAGSRPERGHEPQKRYVTDRKTGKQYDPDEEFDKLKNSPDFQAQMKRMATKEDAGISKEKETKFHAKLDTLVHDTFGKREDEVEEGMDDLEGKDLHYLQGYYSDFHKDLLGHRPRGANEDDWNNEDWLKHQIGKLHDYFDRLKSTPEGRQQLEADGWHISEEIVAEKASRQLCKSSTPDEDLGASNLASCKSQGLRARDGEKSHLIGHGNSAVRIKVGGKRIKGKKYGGPLPDYGTRKGQ